MSTRPGLWHCPGCELDGPWCAAHGSGDADTGITKVSELAFEAMTHWLSGLPRRLAHSTGVGHRMHDLLADHHPVLRDQGRAAGFLHDVGYARLDTGLHSVDGARMLAGTCLEPLAPLVAWHSTARWEAQCRGLVIEFDDPSDDLLADALWFADFTTSPDGEPISAADRLADIRDRYAPDSPVIVALDASMPEFDRVVARFASLQS